ncbi:transposase [Marinicella sediminis]|uniref:Transposase n=1 Tax=Marinicella sediminis TaxID=1792834 RepID=A0ABV7JBE6_9GAMM|nr:transposase [Marinicella sediminis]
MIRGIRYTDEFKQEAVNQVANYGYSEIDVSGRLGISTKSLYDWIMKFK